MTPLMFLLLLWAGVTTGNVEKRIINGADCKVDERLYHVQLEMTDPTDPTNEYFCGGSLLSDTWILTAAHCWEDGWEHKAIIDVHPGTNRQSEIIKDKHHHIYSPKGQHDIMLLQLQNIKGTHKIDLPQICPSVALQLLYGYSYPLTIGEIIQVAGHGYTEPKTIGDSKKVHGPGSESDKLQCADMNVVDCAGRKDKAKDHNFDGGFGETRVFCGEGFGAIPADICPGDSDGAVVHDNQIYGVIKGGDDETCMREAFFINVCYYKQWIVDTMKK